MAALYKILAAVLLLSVVNARPSDYVNFHALQANDPTIDVEDNLEAATNNNPQLYLIIAEAVDNHENNGATSFVSEDTLPEDEVEKRSAEDEADDLETAAGTNVLRPLFVYRQQLAYRERVKKGIKRFGIRPRF